jgi:cytochrome c
MKTSRPTLALLCALIALPLAAPVGAEEKQSLEQIKVAAGAAFFAQECRRCHATDADKASYGPLLEGAVGRKAGTFEGYPYSEALASAGFVWTPGALRAWMEDNDGFLPGTKMRHVGLDDPTVQDFILAYLQSLKG